MKKVLLHACCGPCSTHVVKVLKREYEVTVYFYNPNLYPLDEFKRRLEAAREVAAKLQVRMEDGPYDNYSWNDYVKGHENEPEGGRRCELCYEYRLWMTARHARSHDLFATTLSISPHKDPALVNAIGRKVSRDIGVRYLEADWKKDSGYQISVKMSKEMKLYRQSYCGCRFSMR
jgi:predicted adenine nucleotide alpha hydrolase (AANH) superfamily ATPase